MNKTSLWIVVVVTATWIGFLMGYAVSAHTRVAPGAAATMSAHAAGDEAPSAGGYGK